MIPTYFDINGIVSVIISIIIASLVFSGGKISAGKHFYLELHPIGKGIAWLGKGIAFLGEGIARFRNSCRPEIKENLKIEKCSEKAKCSCSGPQS